MSRKKLQIKNDEYCCFGVTAIACVVLSNKYAKAEQISKSLFFKKKKIR